MALTLVGGHLCWKWKVLVTASQTIGTVMKYSVNPVIAAFVILCTCIGCGVAEHDLFTSVDEDISYEEFKSKFDTRVSIPRQASSIHVYSNANMDGWDLRAVMDVPAEDAPRITSALQSQVKSMSKGVDQESKPIRVMPLGEARTVSVAGWDEPDDVPSWWRQINLNDYRVIATGKAAETIGYVWLYNEDDHKLALWRYSDEFW